MKLVAQSSVDYSAKSQTVYLHLKVSVDESDRSHDRDSIVGMGENDFDKLEDEGDVEHGEAGFVRLGYHDGFVVAPRGRGRVREGVDQTFDQIE